MSTESLNKTSITENYISKKTPKKVNIDVLKRKIYEQQKKEKLVGRIAIFTFFSFICPPMFSPGPMHIPSEGSFRRELPKEPSE